jgi:hypothetical protein
VASYHTLHDAGLMPAWLPALPPIPVEPFQLTSFALSLLLVFRTNSSYARWYEGRRAFGRITTMVRDICRQMLALVPQADRTCRALVARWLIAFCRASKWCVPGARGGGPRSRVTGRSAAHGGGGAGGRAQGRVLWRRPW